LAIVRNHSKKVLVALVLLVIVLGSVAAYYGVAFSGETAKVAELQNIISQERNQDPATNRVATILGQYDDNASVSQLNPVAIYESSNRSVVTIEGSKIVVVDTLFGPQQAVESVIGSGFVISGTISDYVVTNFHVVDGVVNSTVTFWNGDAFPAKIFGTDAYSDLAVLTVLAPSGKLFLCEPLSLGGDKCG